MSLTSPSNARLQNFCDRSWRRSWKREKPRSCSAPAALLENEDLIDVARKNGGQIVVPTGALIGLDAVTAAAVGEIHSVRMVTRKPVQGLAGAPFLVENNINIEDIKEPLKIFDGTAREAAKGFPANLNVAVALSLAGIGPDRTRLEIWADPALTRNVHRVEVDSDAARFSMSIENIPSENPKTGRITALSVIALLRKQRARRCASGPDGEADEAGRPSCDRSIKHSRKVAKEGQCPRRSKPRQKQHV